MKSMISQDRYGMYIRYSGHLYRPVASVAAAVGWHEGQGTAKGWEPVKPLGIGLRPSIKPAATLAPGGLAVTLTYGAVKQIWFSHGIYLLPHGSVNSHQLYFP